ncbi:FHA domain-containing protein, partial [Cellulomonas sp. 179-A 9B4 NHS]|uniref:FHA domain-containing protein n=1 Tax=Cellulomonas sp. 179-A 9B4 NHS TaxID=3142379 RepID=UPI0039A0B6E3
AQPVPDALATPVAPLPPPPAATPEALSPGAHDELVELEHTRVRDPAQLRRRAVTLALLFDTGPRVRVVGRGLAGRGPRAEDGSDILHVVAVDDPSRSVSRVHLEFGPEAPAHADDVAGVWVLDRGSTNGTVVVAPDGDARVLPPGTRAVVRAGWTVRLGERVVRVEDD